MAQALKPVKVVSTIEWAETEFRLPAESSDQPGPYNFYYTPYLKGIFSALDDPNIGEVVTMKAAQVGWTMALIAYLGRNMSTSPCAIVVMFPKDGAGREFNDEKLEPSIRATPALRRLINVNKSRSSNNRAMFKKYPGGFLKLVGSGSPSSVKSTPAKIVIVEEPDDAVDNLKQQGNAITMLWERTKRIRGSKRILGGTPSVDGLSKVQEHLNTSDKRVLPITCNDCGSGHVLGFDNVSWLQADEGEKEHEVYGLSLPDSSVYTCPHCGSAWDDYQRKENIRNTVDKAEAAGDPNYGWVATAEFHGVAGFQELNEIYSCLPGAGVADLVRDFLKAEHKAARGDEQDRIVFQNSKLARTYAYKGDHVDADTLRKRALDYQENVCPAGGLLVTVGIDVQHDRVAVIKRAWGRGEESWCLYWGEHYAASSCADKGDAVWEELEHVVFQQLQHSRGAGIKVSAVGIDSGDGATNDAVYHWVRQMAKKYPSVLVMAIKGASKDQDKEIFSTPSLKGLDHVNPKRQTKADKRGLKVYIVGTNKAKDWLAGRMKREGTGPETHHVYEGIRDDYFEQVTGEVKAPHKNSKGRKVWQPKSGRAVEAWDCEVYALHAARARRVHLKRPQDWDAIEQKILQADLFVANDSESIPLATRPKPAAAELNRPPKQPPTVAVNAKPQVSVKTQQPVKTKITSMADLGRKMNG
jgi:phage terminase large subunit GpA-like protein